MDQLVKIANIKIEQSYATSIKSAIKELLGSCVSMGLTIENKNPDEILKEVNDGQWDKSI